MTRRWICSALAVLLGLCPSLAWSVTAAEAAAAAKAQAAQTAAAAAAAQAASQAAAKASPRSTAQATSTAPVAASAPASGIFTPSSNSTLGAQPAAVSGVAGASSFAQSGNANDLPLAASSTAGTAPEAPELPEVVEGGAEAVSASAEVEGAAASDADVSVPNEDPTHVAPGKAIADAPTTKYHFSNFALGFLGGALLGGAYGVLSSGGKPSSEMGANAAIYGGGAALLLGLAGLFLGATTPEEAKPPKVGEEGALAPSTQALPWLALSAQF